MSQIILHSGLMCGRKPAIGRWIPRRPTLATLPSLLLPLFLSLGSAGTARAESQFVGVSVTSSTSAEAKVAIRLSNPVQFRAGVLREPDRIYIDLMETVWAGPTPVTGPIAASGVLTNVRAGRWPNYTRVVLDLKQAAAYEIRQTGSVLEVMLNPKSTPPATDTEGAAPSRPPAESKSAIPESVARPHVLAERQPEQVTSMANQDSRDVLLVAQNRSQPPAATAQPSDAELVRTLREGIDRLEKRVSELEVAATQAPATPVPILASDIPMDVDELTTGRPTLNLAGFGDFNFRASDEQGFHSGFDEGQFVLQTNSVLSKKVSFFSELSFTAAHGKNGAPDLGFNVEVERSIIRYDYNDALKISFGRYHTPINYWNTAFHHGTWLQTTASRPEMVQFGGSFIPVHFIGAFTEGSTPARGLNLTYNLGLGNGRAGVINRDGDAGDFNNNRAWLAEAHVRPDNLLGFQLGGALYRDRVTAVGLPSAGEWIQAFHIVRERETPEFIAEFANVRHRTDTGVVSNSQAWYAQFAYRVAPKLKPYFRYEYIHIPLSDLILATVPGLKGATAGMRYDISPFSALKLEYRSVSRPGQQRSNVAVMQTSFTF